MPPVHPMTYFTHSPHYLFLRFTSLPSITNTPAALSRLHPARHDYGLAAGHCVYFLLMATVVAWFPCCDLHLTTSLLACHHRSPPPPRDVTLNDLFFFSSVSTAIRTMAVLRVFFFFLARARERESDPKVWFLNPFTALSNMFCLFFASPFFFLVLLVLSLHIQFNNFMNL